MTLSWNEIKTRTVSFTNMWKDEANEDAEAKSFCEGLFPGINKTVRTRMLHKVTSSHKAGFYFIRHTLLLSQSFSPLCYHRVLC